jgi:hypothetical protein
MLHLRSDSDVDNLKPNCRILVTIKIIWFVDGNPFSAPPRAAKLKKVFTILYRQQGIHIQLAVGYSNMTFGQFMDIPIYFTHFPPIPQTRKSLCAYIFVRQKESWK